MKITWSQACTVGMMEKTTQAKSASSACVLVVFPFWTTLELILHFMLNDTFHTLFLLIWWGRGYYMTHLAVRPYSRVSNSRIQVEGELERIWKEAVII
jgi:hypothetical protein